MSVAAPLRIGVVGVGRIGALHAETLSRLEGVSLVLADADPTRAADVARPLGAAVAASPERLLEEGVDAVVIATTTQGHVPLLRLAASAGVPAFCEKPVALELAALAEVSDVVAAAGITVQVGFQRYELGAGDAIAFDSTTPHRLWNLGDEPVHGVWTVVGRAL